MTSEEILNKGNWVYLNTIQFEVLSDLFQKSIPVMISFDEGESKDKISGASLKTINDFLQLSVPDKEQIEEEIWKHCLACNQTTRTSADGGKTWKEFLLEDNLAKYQIKTKEDALQQAAIHHVYIANSWGIEERVFWLSIQTSWDTEHPVTFNYRNGKLDSVE